MKQTIWLWPTNYTPVTEVGPNGAAAAGVTQITGVSFHSVLHLHIMQWHCCVSSLRTRATLSRRSVRQTLAEVKLWGLRLPGSESEMCLGQTEIFLRMTPGQKRCLLLSLSKWACVPTKRKENVHITHGNNRDPHQYEPTTKKNLLDLT